MATSRIEDLARGIEKHASTDGAHHTGVSDLLLWRGSAPTEWDSVIYEPALIVVAQGHKEVRFGDATHQYDPANYLLTSVDLPLMCRVVKASSRAPYLCLRLRFDPVVVGELVADGAGRETGDSSTRGLVVTPVDPALLDAVSRLVTLLDAPRDIPVLAPLLVREVTYRVLAGPQGARLRQIAASGAPGQRVARAISWIKEHVAEPLKISGLARRVGMGLSAFHLHFKTVTGMSPLQFQKRLRLLEARRLIAAAGLTAAEAAFRVGYESPSQFSREYRRAFGKPPRQHAVTMRGNAESAPV